jgi:hypothetical protein
LAIKKFGLTKQHKQRFRCNNCGKTFVWKEPQVKENNERHWFDLWIVEGYNARQLAKISGHSTAKIYRIIHHWLDQKPPALSQNEYRTAQYLAFDGTYFHKDGCLIVLINIDDRRLIDYAYVGHENYADVHTRMSKLKEYGLHPIAITLDGHKPVIRAMLNVWPDIIIQRCLFHIENQGLMWLRFRPKTEAGRELRELLKTVTAINSDADQQQFLERYQSWHQYYDAIISALPQISVASVDLRRAVRLIDNALPNMFCFIKDPKIAKTTNFLEGFYSQIKHHYQRHRGLTKKHKIAYLSWYCYFESLKNSNTL